MNDQTRKEIDRNVLRVLRDAGIREPPVRIEDVLECLELNRTFYDLDDPSLLQRFHHRITVGGSKLNLKLKRVREKIKLAGIWMPDEERIIIDKTLPPVKQEWASFHDTTHTILNWHKPFFLGDTAQTLDPDFQEMLESEANYGASALMFGGKLFTKEGLDTRPQWSSIELLKKRYQKSLVTTLRRYVEFTHNLPMLMMISTPWWLEVPSDQPYPWRHVVPSPYFSDAFGRIDPESFVDLVNNNITKKRGGVVGSFEFIMENLNGDNCEFTAECFFNSYYVLTMAVFNKKHGVNIRYPS
ncbi:MAG: ImmA/IrrE family metallo-endopeptidase [Parachlamydia sp.]|nr:ImmA/IrrE family metallo-endopeptidase [Parachlamydia sp.]